MGQIMFYGITLLAAPFFGYIYGMITFFMPIIYVNGLIASGVGIGLAAYCIYFMQICRNRSKKNLFIGTLFTLLLFYFSAWLTYIALGYTGGFEFSEFTTIIDVISSEIGIFSSIGIIVEVGLHEVFGFPLTGFALISVWVVEMIILLVLPIIVVFKHNFYPYSERLDRLYKKEEILTDFSRVASENILIEKLNESVFDTISNMTGGGSRGHSKITLHTLLGESHHYLSISNVFYSGSKKSTDLILRYYRISNDDLDKIKAKYPTKKKWILSN